MSENSEKSPVENFGEMVKKFGEAVSKIFDDPELKKKAREFGESASMSAKTFGSRFKDEEVKTKFKDLGRSAQDFGRSVADYFKEEKKGGMGEEPGEKTPGEEKSGEGENGGKETGTDPEEGESENGEPEEDGDPEEKPDKKMEESGEKAGKDFNDSKVGRVIGYSLAVFWSAFFLIFLNFYYRYIAYYSYSNGVWERTTFLTEDFTRWLPVVTAALVVSIIGNILLMIYDRYWFRQLIRIIIDLFGLSSVAVLLSIFPFDFTVFPGDLTGIITPIVIAVLILIIIGLSIGLIVKFVKLIIGFIRRAD